MAPHHRRPFVGKQKSLLAPVRTGKNVSPGDIARRVLGANSGASISKVLVVGADGSEPVTRMQIHFADPEQVPAAFNSLATALQSSGCDFNSLGNSSVPVTEIWLTYPLNNRNKTLLSCAARVGEQQATAVAVQSGSLGTNRQSRVRRRQELIWEAPNSRQRGKDNREQTP